MAIWKKVKKLQVGGHIGTRDEAKFGWSEGRGRSKVWLVLKRRTKQSLDGLKAEDEAKFGWS